MSTLKIGVLAFITNISLLSVWMASNAHSVLGDNPLNGKHMNVLAMEVK